MYLFIGFKQPWKDFRSSPITSPTLFEDCTIVSGLHPCWWRVCYITGLTSLVLPLSRDGAHIKKNSSIKVVRTSPALYKKTSAEMFEIYRRTHIHKDTKCPVN